MLSGCQIGYYGQAVKGQYQILSHQELISKKIADTNTPPELKNKLSKVLELRRFAADELKLPVDSHYLKYADLHRPYAVWTVTAAPEFSMEPRTWWFPIVGHVSYRGYFSEEAARAYAAKLEKQGWEVHVGGVQTYSTLGWFKDPILNTFIDSQESELAEIIFHELAHQRLFIPGDTDFNEAFATAVAQEGVRRWFEKKENPRAWKKYQAEQEQNRQFIQLLLDCVNELTNLYASDLSIEQKRVQKAAIIQTLRDNHQKLKVQWGGQSPFDAWFDKPINNARLSSIATYHDLVPAFNALLRAQNSDLEKFYAAVEDLSKLSNEKRREKLCHYETLGQQDGLMPAQIP